MSLTYRFEELPAFLDPHGDIQAGSLDGWAELEFRGPYDWHLDAVTLDGHNGRHGAACEARKVRLDRQAQPYLFGTIQRGLAQLCRDAIADRIAERMNAVEPGDAVADLVHAETWR